MATSSYLGSKSGVQYNGIETDDGGYPKFNLQNALLVGEFKRGPFDRPFKVTKETMEAQLSYDYNNPYYIALEDAFKIGAEYVWVMRVDATVYVWGEWQVSTSIAIQNNKVRYTAYKTNGKVTFDSYANLDLTAAIVQSLHDNDMQQWQAVKDAANELTVMLNWVFDIPNSRIIYIVPDTDPTHPDPTSPYVYHRTGGFATLCGRTYDVKNYESMGPDAFSCYTSKGLTGSITYVRQIDLMLEVRIDGSNGYDAAYYSEAPNPAYDPDAPVTGEQRYVTFEAIAQKIISNASSSNQAISLLAETYIEAVANSIFNTDQSKQFVKLLDIEPNFEANKTQR